jgi:hypothetical protein
MVDVLPAWHCMELTASYIAASEQHQEHWTVRDL